MEQQLYSYSAFPTRAPFRWPNGKKIAFYVGLNIEHYRLDLPSTSASTATVGLVPDPMNYGWRDYGVRQGIWRITKILDDLDLKPSVLLNSDVCRFYPEIIKEGTERGWTWLGHGQTNSLLQNHLDSGEEKYLREMTEVISEWTGSAPRGWLGPALTETLATPGLLHDLGYTYLLDWCNDDQPYALNIDGMYSVPYQVELNDISAFLGAGMTGPDYQRMVEDQLEELVADASETSMVMALPIHTFVVGQPFRAKYLRQALQTITSHPDVWLTTSDEIARTFADMDIAAGGR